MKPAPKASPPVPSSAPATRADLDTEVDQLYRFVHEARHLAVDEARDERRASRRRILRTAGVALLVCGFAAWVTWTWLRFAAGSLRDVWEAL